LLNAGDFGGLARQLARGAARLCSLPAGQPDQSFAFSGGNPSLFPKKMSLKLVGLSVLAAVQARNNLSRTPPRGWMSWELFRCDGATPTDDCTDKTSTNCISEALYQGITDALVDSGLAAAGYASVHSKFLSFS